MPDERPFVVVGDDLVDELPHLVRRRDWIEPTPADQLTDLVLDQRPRIHGAER